MNVPVYKLMGGPQRESPWVSLVRHSRPYREKQRERSRREAACSRVQDSGGRGGGTRRTRAATTRQTNIHLARRSGGERISRRPVGPHDQVAKRDIVEPRRWAQIPAMGADGRSRDRHMPHINVNFKPRRAIRRWRARWR